MGPLLDGRKVAKDIYAELAPFFKEHRADLGIAVVGNDPIIESFVTIKTRAAQKLGVTMHRVDVRGSAATTEVIDALQRLQAECDALIAQLPMPKSIDANAVLSTIPATHDVDALNPRHSSERLVEAPVALAVMEVLMRAHVDPKGKRAVVVGAGRLVGAPSAAFLRKAGANVSLFTLQEGSIDDLKVADIVISGAGKPGLIKPVHLKAGVVLIDAGTSEQGGKVVGDADTECVRVASLMTPVPGGIGPIAVAMIFRNLKTLIESRDSGV